MLSAKRRARQKEQAMTGIVVAIDGSEHSPVVLEWAMKEAALQQSPLTVLTVHQVAESYWTQSPIIYAEDRPEQEKSRQAAQDAVNKVASRLGDDAPASVTVRAVSGMPAEEIINASGDADLLVVGSRGGGGFARLLMGSVSSQVVHHAACPVVVVRS
jgi:nucleotide-binding universal stress UspA family protein